MFLFKWTKSRLFDFHLFFNENRIVIFAKSSETEMGNAGEQPIRDSLIIDEKMSKKKVLM